MRLHKTSLVAWAGLVLLVGAPAATADLVALFTEFDLSDEQQPPATVDNLLPLAADPPGATTLTLGGALAMEAPDGTVFKDAAGTDHGASTAAAWYVDDGEGNGSFTLRFNATGYMGFSVRYDVLSDEHSGFPSASLKYSVDDGVTWTEIDTDSFTQDSEYHEVVRDLSSITDIDDAADVTLCWEFNDGPKHGPTQLDNLQLTGTVIPAPGAALLGFIGLGMVGWFKRRFG